MSIGEKIKTERQKKGISQAALGDMLKITQQAVAKWEKNLSEPDIEMLNKLAEIFKVPIDYLIISDDVQKISSEERAAGLRATKTIEITPIEDDLLYAFRKVGEKHGSSVQHAIITIIEKLM